MRTPIKLEFESFLGGVNLEVPASAIADNELAWATNLKPQPPRVRTRGGIRKLMAWTPTGSAEAIWGAQVVKRAGAWAMVLCGAQSVSWIDSNYVDTYVGILGPSAAQVPWSLTAWNDTIFASRPDDGLRVIHLNPDSVSAAGVPIPTGALTAADGGAGGLGAANYIYVYAYRDSVLGSTGSHSAVSNTLALGANRQVTLTGFVAPTNPRFTEIVIYRSLPNGTGAYYQIAVVGSGTASYTDNIPVSQQTTQASSTNTAPPPLIRAQAVFNGRLWVTDGRLLYPSPLLNPEAFNPADALEVGLDDTEELLDLVSTEDALVVGKRKSIWSVTGTGATSWAIRAVDREHGVTARRSMFGYRNAIWWESDDDFYVSDGVSAGTPLSGEGKRKLRPAFAVRDTSEPSVSGALPQSDGVLFGLVPTDSSARWFYHVPTRSYWPWTMGTIQMLHSGTDAENQARTWVAFSDSLFLMDDEDYAFDDITSLEEEIPVAMWLKAVDGKGKFLKPRRLEIKWADARGGDAGYPVFGSDMLGVANLLISGDRHPSTSAIQGVPPTRAATRTVPISPAIGDPDPAVDYIGDDEWKVYNLLAQSGAFRPLHTVLLRIELPVGSAPKRVRPIAIEKAILRLAAVPVRRRPT